jgi:hypothetical protein
MYSAVSGWLMTGYASSHGAALRERRASAKRAPHPAQTII